MRARPGEVEQVVDRRAQNTADRLVGQGHLGDHGLAVAAALEVAVRRLLVAAHVRLENRALRLQRCVLHDVAHVQRVGVAGHHVRPAGIAGRERPHDVAERPGDVGLDLAQLRVARDPVLVARRRASRASSEARPRSSARAPRRPRSSGRRTPRRESSGRGGPRCESRPTRRPPAPRGRASPRAILRCARAGRRPRRSARPRFDERAVRLGQLVVAERDRERPDDGGRDHRNAGERLLRLDPWRQVLLEDLGVDSTVERRLSRRDRVGIVLARPFPEFHDGDDNVPSMATEQVVETGTGGSERLRRRSALLRARQEAGVAGTRPALGRDPADPGREGDAAAQGAPAGHVALGSHAAASGRRARLRDGLPAPERRARSRGEALLLDDGAGRVAPHRGVAEADRRGRRRRRARPVPRRARAHDARGRHARGEGLPDAGLLRAADHLRASG